MEVQMTELRNTNNSIRGFQVDDRTGLILPKTYFEGENAIWADLMEYFAYKIGTETINQAMDNRFAAAGALSSGDNGYDGMAHGASATALDYKFDTDLNAGGTNAENYIEWLGTIAGPVSLTGSLFLGFNYAHGSTAFANTYAQYIINTTVDSGRTFYFYWRITVN
jgi:hypothetical protein